MSDHGKTIRDIIAKFCAEERPAGRRLFQVHGPYDKLSVLESGARDRPGCYAIYDINGSLRYIGMSEGGVGYRARGHFATNVQASDFWKKAPAATIDLIEVDQSWEAPSLESYLNMATEALR